GPEAAWALYERLTAQNISAMLVDQTEWVRGLNDDKTSAESINDVNDYLQEHGAERLARALDKFEPWIIAGMAGDETRKGRPRVYLPAHDFA
ncbi:toprim domain-containing protein, partial [Klebsiella pneumoniae]